MSDPGRRLYHRVQIRPMIHHVTIEVSKRWITQELEFWSLLGFNPTGLRRLSRKQPPIHWLVCGDESHAVELLPVDEPSNQGLGHLCYELDERRWHIMCFGLGGSCHVRAEKAKPHFCQQRVFLHSLSGTTVEVLLGRPSIKAGPPIELLEEAVQ